MRLPEVGRQLHCLQQLVDVNAAQQLQIQQKECEIRAAQMEIQALKDRQYQQKDSRPYSHPFPTARQPEVTNQLPQINAIEVFLERASYDNLMRARDIGLRAMERGRPERPLQDLSSTDYMVWKRKFRDAARHEGLSQMDILTELPKWFSGPAKEIIETATIGASEEVAEEELTAAFKKMDVLFMACRNNIPDLFNDIVAGSRIHSSDHKRHFHLASTLQKAKKIAHMCGELYHCHSKELLQEIINKRVLHLAVKFWEKHHEAMLKDIPFSFDNLVNMVETWAIIQRIKGVEERPVVTTCKSQAPTSFNNVLTSGEQRQQLTERCNVCSGTHATEECYQLLALEVDDRVRKLASHRLCFHCVNVGHSAKGCVN